jgi:hypothetical protein
MIAYFSYLLTAAIPIFPLALAAVDVGDFPFIFSKKMIVI